MKRYQDHLINIHLRVLMLAWGVAAGCGGGAPPSPSVPPVDGGVDPLPDAGPPACEEASCETDAACGAGLACLNGCCEASLPTVDAGEDITAEVGDEVELLAAVEGGQGELTYRWSLDGGPDVLVLSDPGSVATSFIAPRTSGRYRLRVVVTDERGFRDEDVLLVTVVECVGESIEQLCRLADADCGVLTRRDRCGRERLAACGECVAPVICGGDGVPNRCQGCLPETDQQLCEQRQAACGSIRQFDACGTNRTVICGECAPTEVCGDASRPNVCIRVGALASVQVALDTLDDGKRADSIIGLVVRDARGQIVAEAEDAFDAFEPRTSVSLPVPVIDPDALRTTVAGGRACIEWRMAGSDDEWTAAFEFVVVFDDQTVLTARSSSTRYGDRTTVVECVALQ